MAAPTPESVFNHSKRFFDVLRSYAGLHAQHAPIQEKVAPSVAQALARRGEQLPEDQRRIIRRLVQIVTPPFKISRQMLIRTTRYEGDLQHAESEITLRVQGHTERQRRVTQSQILSFDDSRFPIRYRPEPSRLAVLWDRASQIGFQLDLTQETTRVSATTKLELRHPGYFMFGQTELFGVDDPDSAAGVADCVLRTLSVALYEAYGPPRTASSR